MVVFTCQNCGESLKKAVVEKHYNITKCRNRRPNLTCVDCLKDFFDDEYNAHMECVTEEQRYSAKGTVFKQSVGKTKQQKYVVMIQNLLNSEDLTDTQRKILDVLTKYTNVPRKENKFLNFIKNVGSAYKWKSTDLSSVFKLLSNEWAKEAAIEQIKISAPSSNGTTDPVAENVNGDLDAEVQNTKKPKNEGELNTKKKTQVPEESEESTVNVSNNIENSKENIVGISKKELKKQKKYEKYLAELENESKKNCEEIEDNIDNANEPHEMETSENCEKTSKKLKKKKNKQDKVKPLGDENTDAMEIDVTQEKSKKHKKRKMVDTAPEIEEKKQKLEPLEEESQEVQQAFDWAEVIVTVLQSREEKELSLKRLGKKVITEYQTVKPDHHTYEQLLAKFNKKIKKTPGVRVLKDKAKLIE